MKYLDLDIINVYFFITNLFKMNKEFIEWFAINLLLIHTIIIEIFFMLVKKFNN